LEHYNDKLIVYGAGDLINDYEGFENLGDERYLKYGSIFLVDVNPDTGDLLKLTLIPTYMDRLSLRRLYPESAIWRPRLEIMEFNHNAFTAFRDFINTLSDRDAGGAATAIRLRVDDESTDAPGGPVLTYP
jgi:poly-gamma-glutamate capsule biosynthesis protein CapA/YwtB (metallophosphatase superfamily)